MRWKILFFFPITIKAFRLFGVWNIENQKNIVIYVKENHIEGVMNEKQSVEMEITKINENTIFLDNMKVLKRPADWFNIIKYKNYIDIFKKIRHHGIVCEYYFKDENNIHVKPHIGDERFEMILYRLPQNDVKNDF